MLAKRKRQLALHAIALVMSAGIASAQTPFVRDDSYDFRQTHQLVLSGNDASNVAMSIVSDGDFKTFKLHGETGKYFGVYQLVALAVDMNSDGVWDQVISGQSSEGTIVYQYPDPAPGSMTTQSITCKAEFFDNYGHQVSTTRIIPVKILGPQPRVFADTDGNTFVQLRNEDPSDKPAVLMVEGFDPLNQSYPEHYYRLAWDFINQNLCPDYEVFILNFKENGRHISENAEVVAKAIEALHALSPAHRLAVFGLSMGGVVSRFALASMEAQGLTHHVGLFATFDSPHSGANVSTGLQDEIALQPGSNVVIAGMQAVLQSNAAKDLLIYDTYDPNKYTHPTASESFRAQLDALNGDGYPHQSYNAAISNGNWFATYNEQLSGSLLFDFTIYVNDAVGIPIIHVNSEAIDLGAGSKFSNLQTLRYGDLFTIPFIADIDYHLEAHFNPVFIPTYSAVGLPVTSVFKDGVGNVIQHGTPRFDETLTQTVPLMHHEVSALSRTTGMEWLNRSYNVVANYDLNEGGTTSPQTFAVGVLSTSPSQILPRQVTVNGKAVTYKFAYWDDLSIENPRFLYPQRGVPKVAKLKGYLRTLGSGATWIGNRRIVNETDGTGSTYHAVYESGGEMWYTRNRYGAGWETERPISLGPVGGEPSIATRTWGHEDQIQVHVAWNAGGTFGFRSSNVDNGVTWQPTRYLTLASDPGPAVLPDPDALFWVERESGWGGVYYYKMPVTNNSEETHLVPGTAGNVSDVAACRVELCRYKIAFVRDGRVFVTGLSDPNTFDPYTAPQACGSVVELTTPGWAASRPTIVNTVSGLCVAWEETSGTLRRIAVRQESGGGWSPTVSFMHYTHSPSKPSLGIDGSLDRVVLLWECGDHIAMAARSFQTGQWSGVNDLGPGKAPAAMPRTPGQSVAMWVTENTTPYEVHFANLPAGGASGGGCPFADIHTASGWQTGNSILGRSLTGELSDDAYRLPAVPQVRSGKVTLRIRENEQEVTTLDQVRLVAVDHPPGLTVLGAGNSVVVGNRQPAYQVVTSKGEDITNYVDGSTSGWMGSPGDTVLVTMAPPQAGFSASATQDEGGGGTLGGDPKEDELRYAPGTPIAGASSTNESAATTDVKVLLQTGVIVQRQNADGDWTDVGRWYPRAYSDQSYFAGLNRGMVRLVFVGQHRLTFVGRLSLASAGVSVQAFSPVTAVHSRLGSVDQRIRVSDGQSTTLANGDTVTMAFSVPSQESGLERDYVLVTKGVYTTPPKTTRMEPRGESLPTKVALQQNIPNPFRGTTSIGFDLPGETDVRIEIYDLSGRRVRTLVAGAQSAGRHRIEWNQLDADGQRVPSGIYLYRMVTDNFREQRKLVVFSQ